MKNIILAIVAAVALALSSCTTDFDLYSHDGDSTILYTVLEVDADTNFFRISKSSLENEYAYQPGDIEVRFAGLFEGEDEVDTIEPATIVKMVDGQPRTFYYTTRKLLKNQEYSLFVLRKADSVVISSKTKTICGISFIRPMGKYINLRSGRLNRVMWVGIKNDDAPKINAGAFDVYAYFHYKELMPGATDTVRQTMSWKLRCESAINMYNTTYRYYEAFYTPSTFFTMLEHDPYLNNNSPYGVQRWLEDFEFQLTVYGEELYDYHCVNTATSVMQDVINVTNVDNGVGLMSSRTKVSTFHVIEQICRKRITENYNYGFVYDPNL